MTTLFLLQSGFITANSDFLIKETEKEKSVLDRLYLSDKRIESNQGFYDEKIEKLFKTYHQDESRIRSFEFREEILSAALRAFRFDSYNLGFWIKAQLSQRTVGYLHRVYMREMLRYAYRYPRDMENYTYYRLLSPLGNNDAFNVGKVDIDEELDDILNQPNGKPYNLDLVDILYNWSRDVKGIIDLLTTLHVIFGRRAERSASRGQVSP